MLTKDLAKSRCRGNRIYPSLVEADDPALIDDAAALIQIFAGARGQRCGEVREQLALTGATKNGMKPALVKLLFDQSELDEDDGTIELFRWEVLRRAQELRSQGFANHQDVITKQIAVERSLTVDELKERLYGDLPDCRRLGDIALPSPQALLHRYNCAQVQSLLLRTLTVTVTIKNITLTTKRALFRALRFHRLLGDVQAKGSDLSVSLSGPLSMFANVQSYGARIANFFPHLLHLDRWELEAEVKDKTRTYTLKLDHTCGIKSHYSEKSGYIPPEFQACIDEFNRRYADQATVAPAAEFIHVGRESYCFPDLTMTPKMGTPVHVEIFHRWHAGQLTNRLAALAENSVSNLRLAVEASLVNKGEMKDLVAASAWYQQHGFTFSTFPNPKRMWEVAGFG